MSQAMQKVDDTGTSLVDMLAQCLRPGNPRYTYCSLVMYGARKGIAETGLEFSDLTYTACGMLAKVRDPRDGQEYLLEVRPVKGN